MVAVDPAWVAPVGPAAMARESPADVRVPVLVHDPAVVTVPPAARTVPVFVQLVPFSVMVPNDPSAWTVPWLMNRTLAVPPKEGSYPTVPRLPRTRTLGPMVRALPAVGPAWR